MHKVSAQPHRSCFPGDGCQIVSWFLLGLQVDYRERLYAVGRIPTSANRSEGAPRDREWLVMRSMDAALRPLLDQCVSEEVQVKNAGHDLGFYISGCKDSSIPACAASTWAISQVTSCRRTAQTGWGVTSEPLLTDSQRTLPSACRAALLPRHLLSDGKCVTLCGNGAGQRLCAQRGRGT